MADRPDQTPVSGDAAAYFKPLIAASWLVIAVVTVSLLVFGRDVIVPLAIAFLVWNFINALATSYVRLARELMPRPLRPRRGLALVASTATVVALIVFVVELVADSIVQLGAEAPAFRDSLREQLAPFLGRFGIDSGRALDDLLGGLSVGDLLARTATALTTTAGNVGLIAIYVLFLLLEQQSFDRKIDRLFPHPRHAQRTRRVLQQIERRIETYLRVKTFMSLLTGGISYAILVLFQVDYAGFWAVWVFLLNYIPNLGSIAGVALPTLAALGQYGDLLLTLTLGTVLAIPQFVIGNLLEPRLMGQRVNLSPFVIIASLAVWGSIWGIPGLFLSVPLTMILVIGCSEVPATRPFAVLLSVDGRVDDPPDR
jgi:predicted PurR-regulated permease PerM